MGLAQSTPETSPAVAVPDEGSDEEMIEVLPAEALPELPNKALPAELPDEALPDEALPDEALLGEAPPDEAPPIAPPPLSYASILKAGITPEDVSTEVVVSTATGIESSMNCGPQLLGHSSNWSLYRTAHWNEPEEEVYYRLNLEWNSAGCSHEEILIVEAPCESFVHAVKTRDAEQVKLTSGNPARDGTVTIRTDQASDTTSFELRSSSSQVSRLRFGSSAPGRIIENDLADLMRWCESQTPSMHYEPATKTLCENCGQLHYVTALEGFEVDEDPGAGEAFPSAPAPSPICGVYDILADEEAYLRGDFD